MREGDNIDYIEEMSVFVLGMVPQDKLYQNEIYNAVGTECMLREQTKVCSMMERDT